MKYYSFAFHSIFISELIVVRAKSGLNTQQIAQQLNTCPSNIARFEYGLRHYHSKLHINPHAIERYAKVIGYYDSEESVKAAA